MELVALLLLGTLASKIIDFLKFLRAQDWNAVVTQLAVWVAGIFVMVLGANADAFEGVVIPSLEVSLGSLDFAGQLLVGMTLMSLLSTVYDFRKAVDNTDSANTPSLMPPS